MTRITIGSRVSLHFSLSLTDGTVADSSFGGEPVSVVIGDGSLDRGLELALIGLRPGDHQTLTLMPGQAFGMPDPAAVNHVPRDSFPAGMAPEPGQIIGFSTPDGQEIAGAVIEVGDEEVEVDFNHPLAGREIVFEVEILSVEDPGEEQR